MTSDSPSETEPAAKEGLWSVSFASYLAMNLTTVINDSMFRWLVVPIAKYRATQELLPEQIAGKESQILGLGLGCFILPFMVFSPWSGWLADRFSKRRVTIALKAAEFVIMIAGLIAISYGNLVVMFVVLFLMGTQSALLTTTKFGIIPELVPRNQLSAANGLAGLVTLIGVIVGTVAGNGLYSLTGSDGTSQLWISAVVLLSVAGIGFLASFPIDRVAACNPIMPFPANLVRHSIRDMRLVMQNRAIRRVTFGVVFFWSLASLSQMNIDTFVNNELGMSQKEVGPFLAVLSIGVGLGSVLAGWWSGGRVELGMVPLGTLVMTAASILAYFSSDSSVLFGTSLFLIGLGGGLFNVPLNAFIQERSPHGSLGAILAAGNQLIAVGMILVAVLFPFLQNQLNMSSNEVFLLAGICTLPILIYACCLIPQATIRFIVWLISRTMYRVRTYGIENIPEQGPALLVANHVTWMDGILVLLASSRPIRMIAWADYVKGPVLSRVSNLFGIIPIKSSDGPRALLKSLNTARDALNNGELVCIFAEGQITRTGQLLKFERGMLKILKGTNADVIPVYLDELWGSLFSYHSGNFFWKKPRHWPYPVSINFGKSISNVDDVHVVRQAVLELSADSFARRKERRMIPAKRFIRQSRLAWKRTKCADSSGMELSGGKLLTGALAFHRLLTTSVLKPDVKNVGVLLPPSVGGILANSALSLAGKVTVNLNYTLSEEVINYCIRSSGVKQVITSKRFMKQRPYDLEAEVVFMEDLKPLITGADKARAFMTARFMPIGMLTKRLGLNHIKPDDLMTIVFTSGSTGEPKGVMLSHNNIVSNLDSMTGIFNLTSADTIAGVLPFFHSFGFTLTMWLVLCGDPSGAYHFNPLDGREVAKLCEKHGVSIVVATPTFLRTYLKRCTPEQMKTVNLAIVGAEKLQPELRNAWIEKYGIEPIEGYGATELSPVAAFNVPDSRITGGPDGPKGLRHGTVGRVSPGSVASVFSPETGESLGTNQDGLIKIKGPNVMLGYLDQPEKTAEVIQDGWYNTGDIGRIDEDGFIEITGRQSRFSKIGGEMVPHIRIEQELTRILDEDDTDEPEVLCAVTAVPDAKKGERLIVLHRPTKRAISEVIDELQKAGLPNLWIPSVASFHEVESLPLLGTGKLDLHCLKQVAMEAYS
jgi:acyl-[acyl-carrier-protein]-phospholipid O-acyltransferase/long-chain-fatty-acid--[acyl-carrier-protein] ligase